MQLEHIAVALRRRSPWEALDLGLAMLRAWRGPVLRAWCGTYLPLALLLFLLLWDSPELAAALLWWLKPAFDRVLLFVYGRAVFGAAPRLGEVYRALPGLLLHSGLLAGLTLQRFSLARSFFLPVAQLEQLRGRPARQRRRVLGARNRGYAVWLTLVLANVSVVLGFSSILLADWLRPVDTASLFDWRLWIEDEPGLWMLFLLNAAFMAADTVVEPLYVASGFSLYLNRRTELEGWDIELAFRRMAARADAPRPATGPMSALLLAALLCAALLAAVPGTASADAANITGTGRPSAAKEAIAAVLADPVFGREAQAWQWRYRTAAADRAGATQPAWLARLQEIVEWVAASLRLLVHGALALAAGVAAFLLYRYRESRPRTHRGGAVAPRSLFGLDLAPESLPADVVAAARGELAAGRATAALSLLYRGALVALIHRVGVEFRVGDTEDDCERRVAGRIDGARLEYFRDLLAAWRLAAYAHDSPESHRLERLCRDWGRHFAAGEAA